MTYYTALILIVVLSMVAIQLCVQRSGTLTRSRKHCFYLLFTTIAVTALCEWLGVCLQGTGPSTRFLHILVKTTELSLAPFLAVWFSWVIERRRVRFVYVILSVHVLLECSSAIFGFIFAVDENSVYTHQRFYGLYIAAYFISILYFIYTVLHNVGKYQYSGIAYFLAVVGIMFTGIVLQLVNSELRVVYFTLALTAIMLYVFTLEMIHQTDELTELLNRRGYENAVSRLEEPCVILFFDVDRFKEINDTYGHAFGDTVLRTVGRTIREVYARSGRCYRYGGDEFCVILSRGSAEQLNAAFFAALSRHREKEPRLPYVSVGYSLYDPEQMTASEAASEADRMMYRYKEAHRAPSEN